MFERPFDVSPNKNLYIVPFVQVAEHGAGGGVKKRKEKPHILLPEEPMLLEGMIVTRTFESPFILSHLP